MTRPDPIDEAEQNGHEGFEVQDVYQDMDPFDIREMPHLQADIEAGGKKLHIVDLRIERYPIPQAEKQRMMRAFAKTGVVGDFNGELLHFRPDGSADVIDQSAAAQLPKLPNGWDKIMKFVSEAHVGNKYIPDEDEPMLEPAAIAGDGPSILKVFIRENDGSIPEKDKNKHLPDPKKDGDKFQKIGITHAVQMDEPFTVETIEGEADAKEGDFLCKGSEGDMWPVDQEIFNKTYRPLDAPKLENVFKRK